MAGPSTSATDVETLARLLVVMFGRSLYYRMAERHQRLGRALSRTAGYIALAALVAAAALVVIIPVGLLITYLTDH